MCVCACVRACVHACVCVYEVCVCVVCVCVTSLPPTALVRITAEETGGGMQPTVCNLGNPQQKQHQ